MARGRNEDGSPFHENMPTREEIENRDELWVHDMYEGLHQYKWLAQQAPSMEGIEDGHEDPF